MLRYVLAGRGKLTPGPFGEPASRHLGEPDVRCPQAFLSLDPAIPTSKPLTEQRAPTRELGEDLAAVLWRSRDL